MLTVKKQVLRKKLMHYNIRLKKQEKSWLPLLFLMMDVFNDLLVLNGTIIIQTQAPYPLHPASFVRPHELI